MTAETTNKQKITNLASRTGETYQIGPELVTLKVLVNESGGRYLVIEVNTPPGGGPPIHTHPSDEVFFVVNGEFEFPTIRDGQVESVRGSAGETVHIPGSIPHSYKNVGDERGTLIGVLAPGDDMEGFFREGGIPFSDWNNLPPLETPPDFDRMLAAARKHGLEFLILE
jgi:quercetin dioxygenase-like cupin family protein